LVFHAHKNIRSNQALIQIPKRHGQTAKDTESDRLKSQESLPQVLPIARRFGARGLVLRARFAIGRPLTGAQGETHRRACLVA
jgi:hypothetical protein